jgi:hypothetical protein
MDLSHSAKYGRNGTLPSMTGRRHISRDFVVAKNTNVLFFTSTRKDCIVRN